MSLLEITCVDYKNSKRSCRISGKPDACPICGKGIDPILSYAFMRGFVNGLILEVVFKCPRKECDHLFVAYYRQAQSFGDYFVLSGTKLPLTVEYKEFSETIKNVSKRFPKIYNQAMLAEVSGLDQICGVATEKH